MSRIFWTINNRSLVQIFVKLKYIRFYSSSSSPDSKISQFSQKEKPENSSAKTSRTAASEEYSDFEFIRERNNKPLSYRRNSIPPQSEKSRIRFDENRRTNVVEKIENVPLGPNKRSSSNVDGNRGKIIFRKQTDRKRYQENLEILNSTNPKSLDPVQLAYLPVDCFSLKDEENFIKNFSLKWYSVIDEQIKLIPVSNLCTTFASLVEINCSNSGNLVKTLQTDRLVKLTNFLLDHLLEMTPKQLILVSKSANILFESESEEVKNNLSNKLSSILPAYFKSCVEKKFKFHAYMPYEISYVLFELIKLNVKTPEDICLKDIITLCTQFLDTDPEKYESITAYYGRLDSMARVFLEWSTFCGENFPKDFWSKWMKLQVDYHPLCKANVLRLFGVIHFIEIALRFDKIDELVKYKWFLHKNLPELKNTELVLMLAQEITKTLDSKPDAKVENVVLNEMLDVLKRTLSK